MKGAGPKARKESLLRGTDIFSALPKADLRALSAKTRRLAWPSGAAMFHEGESGDELFILASGQVSISVRAGDAEEIELSRLGPGSFFGEMALLERAPRSATCTALEDCECLALGLADFESLLVERPGAAVGILERMLAIAAERLLKTGSFLSQMVRWGGEARRRAVTDAATGLFNRRYLEDSFEPILAKAAREGSSLTYAMFDLDRFGKLNANYGTEFCDRMIVDVAAAFRRVFSEEDILVRYGGDEFCFLLPGEAGEAALRCGAACEELRRIRFPGHPELRISCSIGLASFPGDATGVEGLKERADKALYRAKETGRDRVVAWPGIPVAEPKRASPGIAGKNRAIGAIIRALEEREDFIIIGHKDPDEDCVSSMVAFALLAVKFNRRASIVLGSSVQGTFDYLLNICRYNSIGIITEGVLPRCSALVLVDTPKPGMIDRKELYEGMREDPAILRIELDHHLGADSSYFGDPGYRLVYEASSTCEIIGHLAMKIENDTALMARYDIGELLSRNLVLAILSGMIGDSQMGRYLKTRRERWFYDLFSALFERMLALKTRSGSGNFSSKEQVFEALAALSKDEDACFRFMARGEEPVGRVRISVLDAEASRSLFSTWGNDTAVTVSKALVDRLAETSGCMGLVGYYDDLARSSFVQFRLRRASGYLALDLREVLGRLGVTNGGGHPGAVGFRIEREAVPDIAAAAREFAGRISAMAEEAR